MSNKSNIQNIAKWLRRKIIEMTTEAGSGHPTSSLSAVELMATLFFDEWGFFQYDTENPEAPENDRLIFSKGHASPLYYALWASVGGVDTEELLTLRKFESRLEGHPTRKFPFTEVPTGSLGQGLGVGIGEVLAIRRQATSDKRQATSNNQQATSDRQRTTGNKKQGTGDEGQEVRKKIQRVENEEWRWWNKKVSMFLPLPSRLSQVFVLLGDSELSEGSVWESARIASHYRLGNLVAIVDVNRLGQRGETMDGWDMEKIAKKFEAFGWNAICVDGHDVRAISRAYKKAVTSSEIPTAIIAKTVKGKGVSFLENKEGCHGKALSREECERALEEIGEADEDQIHLISNSPNSSNKKKSNFKSSYLSIERKFLNLSSAPTSNFSASPAGRQIPTFKSQTQAPALHVTRYTLHDLASTRSVYGKVLAEMAQKNKKIVALDAEVSNSTFAIDFAKAFPERFFEMFIAEQTMVNVATGLARRGYIPFVSTFGAFFARAFDQIRMAQYSDVPLVCVGSHVGVSIGEDGASQMGLEDMALFRSLLNSVVLYPSEAVSMRACVHLASERDSGVTYIRTTRSETSVLYSENEIFTLGGSKTLRESDHDVATVVCAGITVHEALKAYDILQLENISIRVIDAYSIKPIDAETLKKASYETKMIITVEDHFAQGGLGDAVREVLTCNLQPTAHNVPIISLAVRKMPMSGKMEELLRHEGIDAEGIVEKIRAYEDCLEM